MDRTANLRIHGSIPKTLMPDGNKSRVSRVEVESNRPATNFPGIAVDSNPFNRVVDRNVYVVAATRELW
jgi:hypothetical protein